MKDTEAVISFQDIKFRTNGEHVRGLFLTRYYFDLPAAELQERVAPFEVKDGALHFNGIDEDYAWKRFGPLLDYGFDHLFHINYSKPTVYIHRNSGIPLLGTNEFGLIDRGTNIIEVKPLTGCNFQCNYCSVDEGKNDKTHDYVVECEYLVEEAAKIAKTKTHPVEYNIGPQGEPFLYPKIIELIRGLRSLPNTGVISINTNGSFLTEKLIDQLQEAGLTRINLSLNALEQEKADVIAGRQYPLQQVLKSIEYAQGKVNVLIAPTIIPGYNDDQIEGLVNLGKGLKSEFPTIGLQNYLIYPKGRTPVEARSFEEFFAMLKPIEEKTGVNLTHVRNEDFHIFEEQELPKPFRKNDIVKMKVMLPGRYPGEIVAVAQGRCITVVGRDAERLQIGKEIKARIVRDKHNIFKAAL